MVGGSSVIEAYKKFWTNYANFKDRTTLADYWWVVLANFLVGFVIGFLSAFVPFISIFTPIYMLAALVPGLAIAVRRLHDSNRSGWYYLFCLIPLAGPIIVLVFLCSRSVDENNNYGQIL